MLWVVSATGSLVSVPGDNGRLHFLVNNERCIKGYSAKGIEFYIPPTEFLGKKFFEAVPLSEQDSNNLKNGFDEAQKNNTNVEVPYILADIPYLAIITPLTEDDGSTFFVEVQER